MPRGITQDQVNRAADAILSAGDNPTVEKVRATLGTGSPNTITRMLDAWRSQLGERVRQLSTLPEVPAPVGEAMMGLWQLATEHAKQAIAGHFAKEHAALETARDALAGERQTWTTRLAEADTAIAQARTRQELAEHACANLDSQLRDSHALREDLIQQRDRLQTMADRQTRELEALQTEGNARLVAAEQERERTAEHVKTVEDWAHQEVDRVRQEAKQSQQRLDSAKRSYREVLQALEARCEASQQQLRHAEKEVARLSGQVSALEISLAKASVTRKTKRTHRLARSTKVTSVKHSK